MLCFVPLRHGGVQEDPELPFFGSEWKNRELRIGLTYPYAWHLHMHGIGIYLPSAYAATIHMLNICLYWPYVHTRCNEHI